MVYREIANRNKEAYFKSAPVVLGLSHRALWLSLENFFSKYKGKRRTLLIAGPGRNALPYAYKYKNSEIGETNRDRVKALKLNAIFCLDYTGLEETFEAFERAGFFEKSYFKRGPIITSSREELEILLNSEEPVIAGIKANLLDSLPFPSGTFSAVESNLTAHHVTTIRQEAERVYREFLRVLELGGMLHLGEGLVDMSTENKLLLLGSSLYSITKREVIFSDEREIGKARKYFFKNDGNELHFSEGNRACFNARIGREGLIRICSGNDEKEVARELVKRGFVSVKAKKREIVVPIIDKKMRIDREYLRRVDEFYGKIFKWIRKIPGKDNRKLIKACTKAVVEERENARKGIGEYYQAPEDVQKNLADAGFKNIASVYIGPEKRIEELGYPFYNLAAFK